jgi:pimeloyl-ACP methyl ester carboxylesterase
VEHLAHGHRARRRADELHKKIRAYQIKRGEGSAPRSRLDARRLQELGFDDWVDGDASSDATVRRAKHGRVVLLGFSLGSLVAMQLASERTGGSAGLVVLGNAVTLQPLTRACRWLPGTRGRGRMPDVYLLKPRAGDLVDPTAMMDRLVTYDRHPLRAAIEVVPRGAAGSGRRRPHRRVPR